MERNIREKKAEYWLCQPSFQQYPGSEYPETFAKALADRQEVVDVPDAP